MKLPYVDAPFGRGRGRAQGLRCANWRVGLGFALVVGGVGSAHAFNIDTGESDLLVRWDNTLKYSAATRMKSASPALLGNPNSDDGNRNFGKGLISSRFDLFSELDVVYQKSFGLRLSGAAWNDSVYLRPNANPGLAGGAFPNQMSVPANEFTRSARDIHGRDAELLDAFVFGRFDVAGHPLTVRAGRHSLLWGESLFFGGNAIAGGQMPVDAVKLLSVPNTLFKEAIRPVPMISGQVQLNSNVSVAGYLQTSSAKVRTAAVGSYFSVADIAIDGAENLLLGPGVPAAPRLPDVNAKRSGQGGVQLKFRDEDVDYGLYFIRFHNNAPQVVPNIGFVPGVPTPLPVSYYLAYHEAIKAFGASASKNFGDFNVAAEVSFRSNQDLASTQGVDLSALTGGAPTNNSTNPGYAVGRTMHLNISALGSLPRTPLWNEASLAAEIAWNRVLRVTRNAAAADPNATRDGVAFRAVFEPMYRGVLPGLDIGVPVGIGYAPKGSRPLAMNPTAWIPENGGDVSLGLSFTYLDAWRGGLSYTHYYGTAKTLSVGANNAYSWGQSRKDRDFISFSVRRTF